MKKQKINIKRSDNYDLKTQLNELHNNNIYNYMCLYDELYKTFHFEFHDMDNHMLSDIKLTFNEIITNIMKLNELKNINDINIQHIIKCTVNMDFIQYLIQHINNSLTVQSFNAQTLYELLHDFTLKCALNVNDNHLYCKTFQNILKEQHKPILDEQIFTIYQHIFNQNKITIGQLQKEYSKSIQNLLVSKDVWLSSNNVSKNKNETNHSENMNENNMNNDNTLHIYGINTLSGLVLGNVSCRNSKVSIDVMEELFSMIIDDNKKINITTNDEIFSTNINNFILDRSMNAILLSDHLNAFSTDEIKCNSLSLHIKSTGLPVCYAAKYTPNNNNERVEVAYRQDKMTLLTTSIADIVSSWCAQGQMNTTYIYDGKLKLDHIIIVADYPDDAWFYLEKNRIMGLTAFSLIQTYKSAADNKDNKLKGLYKYLSNYEYQLNVNTFDIMDDIFISETKFDERLLNSLHPYQLKRICLCKSLSSGGDVLNLIQRIRAYDSVQIFSELPQTLRSCLFQDWFLRKSNVINNFYSLSDIINNIMPKIKQVMMKEEKVNIDKIDVIGLICNKVHPFLCTYINSIIEVNQNTIGIHINNETQDMKVQDARQKFKIIQNKLKNHNKVLTCDYDRDFDVIQYLIPRDQRCLLLHHCMVLDINNVWYVHKYVNNNVDEIIYIIKLNFDDKIRDIYKTHLISIWNESLKNSKYNEYKSFAYSTPNLIDCVTQNSIKYGIDHVSVIQIQSISYYLNKLIFSSQKRIDHCVSICPKLLFIHQSYKQYIQQICSDQLDYFTASATTFEYFFGQILYNIFQLTRIVKLFQQYKLDTIISLKDLIHKMNNIKFGKYQDTGHHMFFMSLINDNIWEKIFQINQKENQVNINAPNVDLIIENVQLYISYCLENKVCKWKRDKIFEKFFDPNDLLYHIRLASNEQFLHDAINVNDDHHVARQILDLKQRKKRNPNKKNRHNWQCIVCKVGSPRNFICKICTITLCYKCFARWHNLKHFNETQ